jgi:hypothetical protein
MARNDDDIIVRLSAVDKITDKSVLAAARFFDNVAICGGN